MAIIHFQNKNKQHLLPSNKIRKKYRILLSISFLINIISIGYIIFNN